MSRGEAVELLRRMIQYLTRSCKGWRIIRGALWGEALPAIIAQEDELLAIYLEAFCEAYKIQYSDSTRIVSGKGLRPEQISSPDVI